MSTVEFLLWDTSKNVHKIFVFVTSIKGAPLFRGKGHILGPETQIRQIVNKFNCSLVTMVTGFKT